MSAGRGHNSIANTFSLSDNWFTRNYSLTLTVPALYWDYPSLSCLNCSLYWTVGGSKNFITLVWLRIAIHCNFYWVLKSIGLWKICVFLFQVRREGWMPNLYFTEIFENTIKLWNREKMINEGDGHGEPTNAPMSSNNIRCITHWQRYSSMLPISSKLEQRVKPYAMRSWKPIVINHPHNFPSYCFPISFCDRNRNKVCQCVSHMITSTILHNTTLCS